MDTRPDGPAGGEPEEDFGPYLPPRTDPDPAPAEPAGRGPQLNRGWWVALGAVVLVAVGVFVLWPLLNSGGLGGQSSPGADASRNPDPGLDGIIARQMPADRLEPGDCLTDLESVDAPSTVVECDREHEAQLIGRKVWEDEAAFPEDMRAAAEEFCAGIPLNSAPEAQVVVEISLPSEGSWAEGDRRVDCLAVAQEGILTELLVDAPVVEDADTEESEGTEGSESAPASSPAASPEPSPSESQDS